MQGIKLKNIIIYAVCFFIAFLFIYNERACDSPDITSPTQTAMSKTVITPSSTYPSSPSPSQTVTITNQVSSIQTIYVSPASTMSITNHDNDQTNSMPSPTPTPTPSTLDIVTPTSTYDQYSQIQQIPINETIITRAYKWKYGLSEWTWELNINQSSYDYYKSLRRPPSRNYSVYVTHPYDDKYINNLVEKLRQAGKEYGYSEYEIISLAVAFVQSLEYTSDSETEGYDEYPRYPIETLVDNGGDCEDTSILTAALIHAMGYGVVLLRITDLPDNKSHMAVGVKGSDNITGSYYEYQGSKYYYLETTGSGWEIGEKPEEYKGKAATIFQMIPVAILTSSWDTNIKGRYLELKVKVDNLGSATAENVYVFAGFDAGNDKCWNVERSQYFTLGVNSSGVATLYLTPPYDKHTRLVIQIVYQGYNVEESHSKWFDT
jgi:hypothetical protein